MNFNFEEEYILENERVLLRPLVRKDATHLLPFSINEPELWTYSLVPANGQDNLKKYIELALSKKKQEDSYPFIVFDKTTQRYTGSTRFYDIQKEHNTLQLGYTWYGKEFQRTGLNKHCKYLLLQFAFETMEVDRVEFRADNNNKISIAAMQSIGCTIEGVLRSNCKAIEGRRDSIVLSILKDEWFTKVKPLLLNKIS
jgi:RimJ/RimL family protein N-acetyltransferase